MHSWRSSSGRSLRVAVLLGSESAALSPAALAAGRVRAIVNCAFNSAPLSAQQRSAAGIASFAQLHFVDAAAAPGQDARALIEAGAARVAEAVAAAQQLLQKEEEENGGGGQAQAQAQGAEAPQWDAAVLVHCVAGVSRSASVVCAHLMRSCSMSLLQAISAVRAARPVAMPNAGFWRTLWELEADSSGSGAQAASGSGLPAAPSVPLQALLQLHPEKSYPISTHVLGALERS
jgi:hypothetical protein